MINNLFAVVSCVGSVSVLTEGDGNVLLRVEYSVYLGACNTRRYADINALSDEIRLKAILKSVFINIGNFIFEVTVVARVFKHKSSRTFAYLTVYGKHVSFRIRREAQGVI